MVERAKAVKERLGLGEVATLTINAASRIHSSGPIMWGQGENTRSSKLLELSWTPKDTDCNV